MTIEDKVDLDYENQSNFTNTENNEVNSLKTSQDEFNTSFSSKPIDKNIVQRNSNKIQTSKNLTKKPSIIREHENEDLSQNSHPSKSKSKVKTKHEYDSTSQERSIGDENDTIEVSFN